MRARSPLRDRCLMTAPCGPSPLALRFIQCRPRAPALPLAAASVCLWAVVVCAPRCVSRVSGLGLSLCPQRVCTSHVGVVRDSEAPKALTFTS